MQDRVAVNPGRVLITPESGSAYYATLTRADNPTQEGTPLNKANLLKDTTAALLGGNSSMVPDEALVALKNLVDGAKAIAGEKAQIAILSYTGTGKFGSSNPCSLAAPFAPKVWMVLGFTYTSVGTLYWSDFAKSINGQQCNQFVITSLLSTSYKQHFGFAMDGGTGSAYAKKSADGKTIYWYSGDGNSQRKQLNVSGYTYYFVAIG